MEMKHHYQRIDTETGCIIATREDTEEFQDLEITEYTRGGVMYSKQRIIYNIQYDYIRSQDWHGKDLIHDAIKGLCSYGHLQYEYGNYPPEGWVNPYPDNYEPVKPEGADMFHTEGIAFLVSFHVARINAHANFYILEDLDEFHQPVMENLITQIRPATPRDIEKWRKEEEELLKTPFDPHLARDKRLVNLGKQCKEIGVDIPIDPRFID